ncbi:MAG: acyl-CoA dehydrogenase family protein, partial [Myxococcota bacterium]
MDFGLSEDQVLLDQTVRAFLADRCPIERVREWREEGCPNDRTLWKELAELGVAGILGPDSSGGSDLALLDAAVVAQALGHAVTPSPFLSSSVMATVALREVSGGKNHDWLAGLASGDHLFGVAATELFSVREEAGVHLVNGKLSGKAMMAIDLCSADSILVATDKETLVVCGRNADGVAVNWLATTDATRCTSELLLDGVTPDAVFENAGPAVTRMLQAGRITLAADTLGACESMIEQAVAYALQRKQFERLIGSFQAVKHMCAEMIAELEPARSLLWYAAHSFDALPEEAPLMACHAVAHISEIGRQISSVATQVHGG